MPDKKVMTVTRYQGQVNDIGHPLEEVQAQATVILNQHM